MSSIKFILAILVTSLGSGFQHGYHSAILNIPATVLQGWIKHVKEKRHQNHFTDSDIKFIWTIAVSIFSIGGILGALLVGLFADRCGRKRSLMWNNLIALVAISVLMFSKQANSYELFIFGRLLAGINAGLNGGLCVIYLIEISPDCARGIVGCFYFVIVASAGLCSQIISRFIGTAENWQYMFAPAIFPAVFQFICLPFCAESPKFLLISEGNEYKAKKALKWFRGCEVSKEMESLREEDSYQKRLRVISLKKIRKNTLMKKALNCCIVLNIGREFCGLNAVIYYADELMKKYKLKNFEAEVAFGMSLACILSAVLATVLVEKLGRKTLIKISFLGMILNTVLLLNFLLICDFFVCNNVLLFSIGALLYLFLGFYAIGVGPIALFIPADIFTHSSRTLAVCFSLATNWSSLFIVGQAFLTLQDLLGHGTLSIFLVLNVFFYIFVQKHLPETKLTSARDIINMYNPQLRNK